VIGFLVGYGVGRSRARARDRWEAPPDGYGTFQFMVITGSLLVGAFWPIHLGFLLTRWGVHVAWSVAIAALAGAIALVAGSGTGYIIIAIVYAGIWLAVLIDTGTREEERFIDKEDVDG
jgi:hypothetical protein